MKVHRLVRRQHLARPRNEVFAFFEDATNLARITPNHLGFEILTPPPIVMGRGTRIDYRIRLFGLPMRWKTEIEVYDRGEQFVDRQMSGPYKLWRHTHTFEDAPDGGTEMGDVVEYAIGWGPAGAIAHRAFVRRTVEGIFDYRAKVVENIFSV